MKFVAVKMISTFRVEELQESGENASERDYTRSLLSISDISRVVETSKEWGVPSENQHCLVVMKNGGDFFVLGSFEHLCSCIVYDVDLSVSYPVEESKE